MRTKLTAKLSVLMTLLTGLTLIVILVGCSLSFLYFTQQKVEQRVITIASMIDIHLVSSSPEMLRPWLREMMVLSDIKGISLISDNGDVFKYTLHGNALSDPSQDHLSQITVSLIHHPGAYVTLTYQNIIGSYYKSMLPIIPLSVGGGLVILILLLFLLLYRLKAFLMGQELLENRARKIVIGERGSEMKGSVQEHPTATGRALDILLSDLQIANEQRNRLDTLIRAFAAQDAKTGLSNRQFFENQLSTLLDEHTQAGVYGMVMIIRLPDFEQLRDLWSSELVEDYQFTLINLLSTFVLRYPGAILARYVRNDFAVLLPYRSLKEANGFASQLLNGIDALPSTRMVDKENMLHIGICAWRNGQTKEQVIEQAEIATRNAVLQGGNNWCVYDENLPDTGRGSVKWRTLLEHTLKHGGLRFYQKPAVNFRGVVLHRDIQCRILDGDQEILPAEYMLLVEQFGLSEQYDQLVISRLLPLLRLWPDETFAIPITVTSLLCRTFQLWLQNTLMQCEKSLRSRIIFELAEEDVCQHISSLSSVVRLIVALDGQIAVINAGLTVVSTPYIKALDINLVKLHPAVVRNIGKQAKNQLFLQSLVEACNGTRAQVFASGVRSLSEWRTLIDNGVAGAQGDFIAAAQLLDNDVKKYSKRYSV
ncbi:RNase E specificity factor CsrD [Citrobacter sp. JGM124]|uniref:RNase E specificity factor CsrD n=1 Tax=Citrobacter sp. JGM124 TaxID=2799789 RepID=UPI001BAD7E6D|nr:RNase E specificity factor CsrD [Citrobacter sp. JGM124]MBS0849563.1 RNase E specificity factor CsrD [Citrobacter sp. JGM124]